MADQITCELNKFNLIDRAQGVHITTGYKRVEINNLAQEMSEICKGLSVTEVLPVEYAFEYPQKMNELECTTEDHELHTSIYCTNGALLGVCCPVELE